jgi:hypothetical protein
LLAAKSPPEITALLGDGEVWRVVGGEGLDHIRVSRFNLGKQTIIINLVYKVVVRIRDLQVSF